MRKRKETDAHTSWYLQLELCHLTSLSKWKVMRAATQIAREQEVHCAAFSSGVGNWETEKIQSIACNPKNAAKFKDSRDDIIKAISFFSVPTQRQYEKGVYTERWKVQAKQWKCERQHVCFEIVSHLNQNFLGYQEKKTLLNQRSFREHPGTCPISSLLSTELAAKIGVGWNCSEINERDFWFMTWGTQMKIEFHPDRTVEIWF